MDISNLEKWHFEMTEKESNAILSLVLMGNKRATSSSLPGYADGEPLPTVGDISVITQWDGTPACVVKTTNVITLPFCEMTFELAKLEGEDDTLESWKKSHAAFWIEEGKKLGYTFSEDMPIVFEEFEILERLG